MLSLDLPGIPPKTPPPATKKSKQKINYLKMPSFL